jgi:predicted MFS family arabinose efflux permease
MQPAQSTLVAILAPNDVRHRASAVSRVAANFGLGVGAAIGGVVAGFGLRGFQALFFANAATYLVYVLVLAIVVREKVTPRRFSRGYRTVLGDRVFVGLVLTNVAMIAVGWGVFSWVVPTYAAGTLSIDTGLVGLLLLANAATVVIAQVPVARIAEGRRRAHALALGCACWIVAYALVATAHVAGGYPALMLAAVIIAVGECFHSVALVPLVAQLAPTELRGRYMAAVGLSFLLGLGAGSTVGIPALGRSPALAFWGAAGVAAAAMLSVLALERRLPDEARRTPRVSLPARLAP